MAKCYLTTFDNPFDPATQLDAWRQFDWEKGYYSEGLLARIARTSDKLSDEEYNEEIERAIDKIIEYDFLDVYRKIKVNTIT